MTQASPTQTSVRPSLYRAVPSTSASKKLQEAGIVKGTKLNVDLKELGYDVIAFIGIYLEKSSLYDSVAKELRKIPQIVRLNYTTGNYSMFAEIVCKDINQLRYVLHDELQKIRGIERTETFISLEESFNRNVQVYKENEKVKAN